MSINKRVHPRSPLKCRIKISHACVGETIVNTRNISDGGVFILTEHVEALPIGTIVQGQVQGMMVDAPVLSMEVVRVESEGLGLKFVN